MARKYGIQLRGLGKALKPRGPGVIRPKPTDRYGQQMKPKPIRPGKKDGGSLNMALGGLTSTEKFTSEPARRGSKKGSGSKELQKLPTPKTKSMPSDGKRRKMKNGGFPDLSGDGKVTKKDILMGRGVIKKGKKA